MKNVITALLLALFAAFALAVAPHEQVIVSYPQSTPEHILEEAKEAIIKAGGAIVHEYKIIKGFAATAPEKALEMVQSLGNENNVLIESDKTVSVQDS